jgi:hypothetical protein
MLQPESTARLSRLSTAARAERKPHSAAAIARVLWHCSKFLFNKPFVFPSDSFVGGVEKHRFEG